MNLRPIIVLLLLTILLTGAATLAGDECDTEHELAPYVSRDDRDFVKLDKGGSSTVTKRSPSVESIIIRCGARGAAFCWKATLMRFVPNLN